MDSILTSVKKILGIKEEYDVFDPDLIMYINSVFVILSQIGIASGKSYSIYDDTQNWTDYIPESPTLELVKTYVCAKVRMMFDPPTSSILSETYDRLIQELEERLKYEVETIIND